MMKKLIGSGAFALLSMAGSAQAATFVTTFNGGSGALPTGSTVVQDFGSMSGSIGPNAYAVTGSNNLAFRPAYGSTGSFGAVLDGGSYAFTLPTASSVFSFVLGSLDAFNYLTLNFSDGLSTTLMGGAIVGSPTLFDSGNRTDAQTNGVVSYTVGGGATVTSAVFASKGGNSFEFDNLATGGIAAAVPEPATWGMMILGFGLMGAAMRRRPSTKVRFA